MTVDLERTPLFETLGRLTVPIIKEARERAISLGRSMQIGPLRPADDYVVTSYRAAGQVLTVCKQLDQCAVYISQFRGTEKLKKHGVNRFTYVIYHLENHVIRTRMLFDRVLILVNVALRLGNPQKNCTPQVILSNRYVQDSEVSGPVKDLEGILGDYRPRANIVLHRESYDEPQLDYPELFYLLEEIGEKVPHGDSVKAEMDRYVIAKQQARTSPSERQNTGASS